MMITPPFARRQLKLTFLLLAAVLLAAFARPGAASIAAACESHHPQHYRLTTMWLGEGKSLDLSNPGQQPVMADSGYYSGQHWKITPAGNGYYRLTTEWLGEGKSLDLSNPGQQPVMADSGYYSGQHWKITPLGNGYYRLTTEWLGEGKSLDLSNPGQQPVMADSGYYSGQYWKITNPDGSVPHELIAMLGG